MDSPPAREALAASYFWLLVFFVVYSARPEDWIPGLHVIPLAKISGLFAALGLALSLGRSRRRIQDLPIEMWFTLVLTVWLMASSLLSPIWRGGAFWETVTFSELLVAMAVAMLVVTSVARLRGLLFVQGASVAVVCAISLAVGRSNLRMNGVLNGNYYNPNDLAFAIALNIPLCFAFFLRTRSLIRKGFWSVSGLIMAATLFLTGSRGGVIALGIGLLACVWQFGIRGKRPQLVAVTLIGGVVLALIAGGVVKERFAAMSGDTHNEEQDTAYESYKQRSLLIDLSLSAIAEHPLFGLGPGDFQVYSGMWREVHLVYLQVCVEGGIPALVLYLLIFGRGFANLRRLRRKTLDSEADVLASALSSMLVVFVVGALFSPDAYQYFPFFTVTYIAVLRMTVEEQSRPELYSTTGAPPKEDLAYSRKYALRNHGDLGR